MSPRARFEDVLLPHRLTRRAFVRALAFVVALLIALLLAVLAHDVRSWRQTLGADAARYALAPAASERWVAPTLLPAGISQRALAVNADRGWLSALRFFALAHAINTTTETFSLSPAQTSLFQSAEAALGRETQDADPARASQAYVLLAVLLFSQTQTSVPDPATSAAAVIDMQNAVRIDSDNEQAKVDLELLLRQLQADNAGQQGVQGNKQQVPKSGHRTRKRKGSVAPGRGAGY